MDFKKKCIDILFSTQNFRILNIKILDGNIEFDEFCDIIVEYPESLYNIKINHFARDGNNIISLNYTTVEKYLSSLIEYNFKYNISSNGINNLHSIFKEYNIDIDYIIELYKWTKKECEINDNNYIINSTLTPNSFP